MEIKINDCKQDVTDYVFWLEERLQAVTRENRKLLLNSLEVKPTEKLTEILMNSPF